MKKIVTIITCFAIFSIYSCDGMSTKQCPQIIKASTKEELAQAQDPNKDVASSLLTKKLDCSYLNPPKEEVLLNRAFTCKAAKHNVKVLENSCHYYRSQSTSEDGPIYCLVKKPETALEKSLRRQSIGASKDYAKIYCK